MGELWDVYDINKNKTGKIAERGVTKLQNGEYHIAVEAVIINHKGDILISKRAAHKKYGLMWELNGGSILKGETSIEGMIRELKEELGITVFSEEAIFLKEVRRDKVSHCIKEIWLFRKDIEIEEITFADEEDTVVTLYESNKVVFQGISADIDANMWKEREKMLTGRYPEEKKKEEKNDKNEKIDNKDYYFVSSIGSDEVGTGDYFGPIVVTASYVNKKDINFLENLGVRDSKKITDDKIIKIAPEIIKRIPHVTIILTNEQYNNMHSDKINMNTIKAILHNKVLYTLLNKDTFDYEMIVVDQFVNPRKYYEYLNNAKYKVKNISFTTKAEDKCLSVACASIISRYIFLKEIDKMSQNLGIKIPLGAGNDVDNIAKQIKDKYSMDKLNELAKLNFKNTEKIQ